jgi:tubulin polyglutamylase TTLL1
VKPAGRAQGKGIFLLRKLQQLKKISQGGGRNLYSSLSLKENYVISQYI